MKKTTWIWIAIAIITIVAIITVIVVCCNQKPDNNKEPVKDWWTLPYSNTDRIVIEENRKDLPQNGDLTKANLTPEVEHYYFNKAINALITLDAEELQHWSQEDMSTLCNQIKSDKKLYAMWIRTIGNLAYLPDSNMFYGKMPNHTYYIWYTEQAKQNRAIPESPSKYTLDELYRIWEEYYPKTPNSLAECRYKYTLKDGYIQFEMDNALLQYGVSSIAGLIENNFAAAAYAELVLGWDSFDSGWNDFTALDKKGQFAFSDVIQTLDVDKMMQIVADQKVFGGDAKYADLYHQIYTNEEYVSIVKEFMKDVTVYRNFDCYIYFVPVDTQDHYGRLHYWLEETDRYRLKDCEIYDVFITGYSDSDQSQWYSTFYVLAHQALFNEL